MTFAYCHADSSICTSTYHKRAGRGGNGVALDMKQHKATQVVPKFSLIKRKTQEQKKKTRSATMSTLRASSACRQNYFNLCNVAHLTATFCHARNLSCQWATHTHTHTERTPEDVFKVYRTC